jgi:ubiquinone/menaquinone biosynthesis C-methylase UbiE
MALTHAQASRVYDHFGSWLDTQAFYEDRALDELVAHATFGEAASVAELGCGTGRFALRLLSDEFASTTSYVGMDVSQTMVEIAQRRLMPYQERVKLVHSDGTIHFPLPDHSVDRLVATYVFDILSKEDIHIALAEARRLLSADGKLCLVSLTEAKRLSSRLICGAWNALYRLHAPLVGGCRPIHLDSMFDEHAWMIDYHSVVIQFGVPSEVMIVSPRVVNP